MAHLLFLAGMTMSGRSPFYGVLFVLLSLVLLFAGLAFMGTMCDPVQAGPPAHQSRRGSEWRSGLILTPGDSFRWDGAGKMPGRAGKRGNAEAPSPRIYPGAGSLRQACTRAGTAETIPGTAAGAHPQRPFV